MINVVIPMAGLGSRFVKAGFSKPKPFIDVCGEPMIIRVLQNLYHPDFKYILIAQREHIEKESNLVSEIEKRFNVVFLPIEKLTEGTACTILYARKYINNDLPLLIANSDQIVDVDIFNYITNCIDRNLDGSIMTFIDKHKDPKWSFAKLNEYGLVAEVQEKKVISEYATVGIYFFTKGRYFIDAAIDMILENNRVNNEFYTCPAYNYLIEKNHKIGIYNINDDQMYGLGTPADLEAYINKKLPQPSFS